MNGHPYQPPPDPALLNQYMAAQWPPQTAVAWQPDAPAGHDAGAGAGGLGSGSLGVNAVAGPSSTSSSGGGGGPGAAPAARLPGKADKKRRKEAADGSHEPDSPGDKAKRTKTGRACDACRTKKIRCDILAVTAARSGEEDTPAICAHCKQSGIECTSYLPITETRFKKKKQDDSLELPPLDSSHDSPTGESQDLRGRLEGPTSIPFLLHTTLPSTYFQQHDLVNHTHWEVTDDGHGMIRVRAPPINADDARRSILTSAVVSELVNAYFDHLAGLFPIVLRSDFIERTKPNPLLLYAICGVAATRRDFPRDVFAAVRGMINGLLKSNDIQSDARFEHVQAFLLLAQVGDLHAQPTAATASASLLRTGTAIRMAQDLGLHRDTKVRNPTPQDLINLELRRRVWATCVILDRWYGAALGVPLLIDLSDCDVLIPSSHVVTPDVDRSEWPLEPSYDFLTEHLKLSIIVGRVIKTVYGPTGLKHASADELNSIVADMAAWMAALPAHLQYTGTASSHAAGLLHLAHAAVQFLLWRVFMRITHICPPHLKHFMLNIKQWTLMMRWSRESIEWLAAHDDVLDSLFIYPYTATSAALIQYHTWARRRDPGALDLLRLVRDTAERWARLVQPDQQSIRRKTCETMTLLYEAALKTNYEGEEQTEQPVMAPTAGVQVRADPGQLVWRKDPSLPDGGVFVAKNEQALKASGAVLEDVVVDTQQVQDARDAAVATGAAMTLPQMFDPAAAHDGMGALSNMNPQMTSADPILAEFDMFQQPAFAMQDSHALDVSLLDVSLLDALPDSNFDWNTWGQYFDRINRVHPTNGDQLYYQG